MWRGRGRRKSAPFATTSTPSTTPIVELENKKYIHIIASRQAPHWLIDNNTTTFTIMPYPIDHKRFVCGLYKQSLKTLQDWQHDYLTFRRYALRLRQHFDAHKHEQDERKVWLFLRSVEFLLNKFKHPEPYVYPLDPGGVAHGREWRYSEEFIRNGDGRGKMPTLC